MTSSNNPRPPRVPPKTSALKPAVPSAAPAVSSASADPSTAASTKAPEYGEVVARGATYYRMTRYIMVVVLLVSGGWFGYDGLKGWPDENVRIAEWNKKMERLQKTGDVDAQQLLNADPVAHKPPHSDHDISLQKKIAVCLPLLAVGMLAWALYNSRGAYRLVGDTLSVPGHPPVRLADILEVDKKLWDRKGIAYLVCKTNAGKIRLRLDDFIYEREPTDQIYDRVVAYLQGDFAAASNSASQHLTGRKLS